MLEILICEDDADFANELAQRISALPDFLPGTMRIHCLTQPGEMCNARFFFEKFLRRKPLWTE